MEETQTNKSIAELAKALAKAQSQMEAAKKDAANPFFKTKYADLASVWEACRKPLTDNGLSIVQHPTSEQGRVSITTMLLHSSGEYLESTLSVPVLKADPQSYGSALTYARRYALSAIVGIAPEDDDGNAASQKDGEAKKSPVPQRLQNVVKTADQMTPKATTAPIKEGPQVQYIYNLINYPFKDEQHKPALLNSLAEKGCSMVDGNPLIIQSPAVIEGLKKYLVPVGDYLKEQEAA